MYVIIKYWLYDSIVIILFVVLLINDHNKMNIIDGYY